MSATNSTPIINLPLFIGSDKPAWLTDWNGAMNAIDTAIANLQTAESGTATSLASLAQSVEALSGTVSQHTTAIQTVTTATAGNTGNINTINSLIGNGEPTTEDKTIIGAINEIYAEIGGGTGVAAEDVTYSNTSSGLKATDVQAAIDEVNAKIPQGGSVDADDVAYNNTTSGLSATNVQDAIDEVNGKFVLSTNEHVVGKSTNGDVIYEKTYTATGSWSDIHIIDANFNSTYFKKVLSIDGAITLSTGTIGCPMIGSSSGTTTFATFTIPSTGLQIAISGMTVSEYIVTIRYTKN